MTAEAEEMGVAGGIVKAPFLFIHELWEISAGAWRTPPPNLGILTKPGAEGDEKEVFKEEPRSRG